MAFRSFWCHSGSTRGLDRAGKTAHHVKMRYAAKSMQNYHVPMRFALITACAIHRGRVVLYCLIFDYFQCKI